MFFTGEFSHQLDDKNRIRIPRKLKEAANGAKFYFAKGTDDCIFVLPESVLSGTIEELASIKMGDEQKQKGLRSFTRSIEPVEEDKQGRALLSLSLRAHAHVKKDIVFIGAGNRVEIWAKEVYDKYFEDDDKSYNADFGTLGI